MIGAFEGYSDNDQISFCPKCGEEIETFYGDGSASCKKCNIRFAVIEIESEEKAHGNQQSEVNS